MIHSQPKTSNQLGYGTSFYLLSCTLMMSAAMSSAVAEDAAINSITAAATREVSFVETTKQTNIDNLSDSVPLDDLLVTVGRGDSLSSILRERLGSLSALRVVASHNNLDTPDTLVPGQKILIPGYLFPKWSDIQSDQLENSPVTLAAPKSTMQTTQSEGQYLVVDLAELTTATDPKATVQTTQSQEEYVFVDLAELASVTYLETSMKTTKSEEEYIVVDLAELTTTTDPETTVQTTQSEEQYLVVDLADVNMPPDRTVRVNRGDSLSSILRENLGSLRALQEVTRYNNLDTPDVLEPGQIILIPGYLSL